MTARPPSGDVHVVPASEAGVRLDKWLAGAERLGSRSKAEVALERGRIFVDEVEQGVRDAGRLLRGGERVRLWRDRPGSAKKERPGEERILAGLRIVHEDEEFLVIDKPAGLLTVARDGGEDTDDTVISRLERWLDPAGKRRIFPVHRIDRGTSGLVVVARHGGAVRAISIQFRRREPERRYLAVVHGTPEPAEGTWEDELLDPGRGKPQRRARPGERGAEAIARYRVAERFGHASLLVVELVTGKRNQIRVQAMLRGHPLVGDPLYTVPVANPIEFSRPALHAARLAFRHPRTGKPMVFESPLPPDIHALIERLRGEGGGG